MPAPDRPARRAGHRPLPARAGRWIVPVLLAGLLLALLAPTVVGRGAPGNSALTASIEALPRNGSVPLTVAFQATAFGGSGTYVAYLWTFGDGGVGSGASVQHAFNTTGNFTVQLTVWDSANATAGASTTVTVRPAAGPAASPGRPGSGGPAGADVLEIGIVAVAVLVFAAWRFTVRRAEVPSEAPTPPGPAEPSYGEDGPSPDPGVAESGTTPWPAGTPDEGGVMAPPPATDPGGASTPTPPTFEARRALAHRLLLELSTLPRGWETSSAPARATQAGLARRLGVQQSGVSKVLRRLEAAGIVRSELGHAEGASRRVRVYRLTERGERSARVLQLSGPVDAGGTAVSDGVDAPRVGLPGRAGEPSSD